MELSMALCDYCEPRRWNFDKYDEYGDVVPVELCPQPQESGFFINGWLAKEIKPYDTAAEAQDNMFTEKNKIYCKE